jgi:hypothetical protein
MAVVVAVVVVLWPRADRITLTNYDLIREGISRAQVCAILGAPDDYTTRPLILSWPPGTDGLTDFWWGNECAIGLIFDKEGRGRLKCHTTRVDLRWQQTALENLLWRAKRQWHRWFP